MKRKLLVGIIVFILGNGFIFLRIDEEEERKHQSFSVIQIGTEVISVYRNRTDFTEIYKALEQKAKEEAAKYLNKDISEVKFDNYTILEMVGMTIEATVEDMHYTFIYDMDGNILNVNCRDEYKLKW